LVAEQVEQEAPDDEVLDFEVPENPNADIIRRISELPHDGHDKFDPFDPNDTSSSNFTPHFSQVNS
jgi:hypothetical protein